MDSPPPSDPRDQVPARDRDSERGLESTRRTSSLPSGVFRTASPTVERHLAGDVGEIFLRHMARIGRPDIDLPARRTTDPKVEERNRVTPSELEELLADLRHRAAAAAPSVAENLAAERAWVLLDLAMTGSGTAREFALTELSDAFVDPTAASSVSGAVREEIRRALGDDGEVQ